MDILSQLESAEDLGAERIPFDGVRLATNSRTVTDITELAGADKDDLLLAVHLYLSQRHENYKDYMATGLMLFEILVRPGHDLRDKFSAKQFPSDSFLIVCGCGTKVADSDYPALVNACRNCRGLNWSPAYEIQRIAMHTGIHWTWVEWAFNVAMQNFYTAGKFDSCCKSPHERRLGK
tara:strand:- start:31833 stop:32366 length:534 start_codon:yes stop_codon:yes gene_type:complete